VNNDLQQRSFEWGTIICADWSKSVRKRAVYAADIATRSIRRLRSDAGWSVTEVLACAEHLSSRASVLVGFDVPFGVPHSYLVSAKAALGFRAIDNFVDLLLSVSRTPTFFEATYSPESWKVEQPFFAVPAGEGSLAGFRNAAGARGVELSRRIDRVTKAKSLFITSGIPGSVGSAATSLWQEIAKLRNGGRQFRMWPFEGDLDILLRNDRITFAEVYPRAAYSTALLDGSATARPPLRLAKTDANVRSVAIEALVDSSWVGSHKVALKTWTKPATRRTTSTRV
jgi:hypothetical protein